MNGGGWSYLGVFVASSLLALVLTPLALRLAFRHNALDVPGGYKAQASPVPYLGGLAIVVSFAVVVVTAALLRPPDFFLGQLLVMMGLGVGLSIMGLVDDLRGLGPWLRLIVECLAGIGLYASGTRVEFFDPEIVNAVVTVVWVIGIANAFNLLDNMDGLSAGVAAIAAASFFTIAAVEGQFLVAGLSVALAGCATGFLRQNIHPAKIYMGDAGSLFLGFMLAAIGIRLRIGGVAPVTVFVPILVVGVAIFDTTLVTITRLLHRRNPLVGGRDHTSHRLVFVGIPVRATVALIYGVAIVLGWLGLIMSRLDGTTGVLLMLLVLSVGLFLGLLLAAVPVYENSTRRRLMIQEVAKLPGDGEDAIGVPAASRGAAADSVAGRSA